MRGRGCSYSSVKRFLVLANRAQATLAPAPAKAVVDLSFAPAARYAVYGTLSRMIAYVTSILFFATPFSASPWHMPRLRHRRQYSPKRLLLLARELHEKISRFLSLLLPCLDALTDDMEVPDRLFLGATPQYEAGWSWSGKFSILTEMGNSAANGRK